MAYRDFFKPIKARHSHICEHCGTTIHSKQTYFKPYRGFARSPAYFEACNQLELAEQQYFYSRLKEVEQHVGRFTNEWNYACQNIQDEITQEKHLATHATNTKE